MFKNSDCADGQTPYASKFDWLIDKIVIHYNSRSFASLADITNIACQIFMEYTCMSDRF